jgi:hypothetical protein
MALEYNSGGGGGIWGLGWQLSGVMEVTRRTRLGLPRYEDGARDPLREDVFSISGAEDLVPVYLMDEDVKSAPAMATGDWKLDEKSHHGFTVRRYRPRIDGLYSRVERWADQLDPEDVHWRFISPANEMMIFGRDENSRIMDGDGKKIFSWLCSEWYDCRGNARLYTYKKENGDGVDLGQANEQNRTAEGRATQRYLKRIK